ncbi:MAG: hypothetical protein AB1798_16490, partial [Spirochaetota bacterium]
MKGKRITFILTAVVVTFLLIAGVTTCGFFIAPQQGRENPLDPGNPDPPPAPAALTDFQAKAASDSLVNVSWSVPAENKPAGMVLVRKAGAEPADKTDGLQILADMNAGTYNDSAVAPNTKYWYSAWTYDNTERLFSGPVSDWADTTVVNIKLYPVFDSYIDPYSSLAAYQTFNYLNTSWNNYYYSVIKFDETAIPAKNYIYGS